MITAETAPGVSRAEVARAAAAITPLTARPRTRRGPRSGSSSNRTGSACERRPRATAPARGTVRLSSRVVGIDSTRAQNRTTGSVRTTMRGEAQAVTGSRSVLTMTQIPINGRPINAKPSPTAAGRPEVMKAIAIRPSIRK